MKILVFIKNRNNVLILKPYLRYKSSLLLVKYGKLNFWVFVLYQLILGSNVNYLDNIYIDKIKIFIAT
jgi:hypothetical protein